ncbi:MAG TPA: ABC transporter substrate-binding protein [Acetobacteraceae bacterium]|nr:ABC transporter substrate-binding protein [Acetobacteraceae bacterium]
MTEVDRRTAVAMIAGVALAGPEVAVAKDETVLRIGMTLADIPLTTSQPNQGAEGWRFIGVTLYDGLVNWDLTSADKPSGLIPGLATEWGADPSNRRRWTFKLRQGVKFHDGTPWNADAAMWNLDKLIKKDAPQYDAAQVAQVFGRFNAVTSYKKIDDYTIEMTTKDPDSMIPYYFGRVFFASPAQWEKVGRNWAEFAKAPAGTGPWKLDKLVPRDRAELVKNTEYWDKNRIPKTDRLVLVPIPDAVARTSALLSGQVDWVEAPAPDMLPRLKQAGLKVVTNSYPHTWPWWFSQLPDSPFKDIRVRKAANLAIERKGIVDQLLAGLAKPAVGQVWPGHKWFGKPTFDIKYDPEQAKKLLAEAGYSKQNPVKAKILITAAGSGQMQPLPMNQAMQENLRDVGIEVEFEVIEWNTMTERRAAGAAAPEAKGIHAINNSWAWWDPDFGMLILLDSRRIAPKGSNWMNLRDPAVDAICDQIRNEFDQDKQDALIAKLHEKFVDEAAWLFVVHDLNPRAMTNKVKGFVQAQHWIQDLTTITMG